MDFDRLAAAQRASTGCGEDMLGSIRRLLVDRTAFAVISAAGSAQETQKGKGRAQDDDCIRLNTVAMELLSFQAVGTVGTLNFAVGAIKCYYSIQSELFLANSFSRGVAICRTCFGCSRRLAGTVVSWCER